MLAAKKSSPAILAAFRSTITRRSFTWVGICAKRLGEVEDTQHKLSSPATSSSMPHYWLRSAATLRADQHMGRDLRENRLGEVEETYSTKSSAVPRRYFYQPNVWELKEQQRESRNSGTANQNKINKEIKKTRMLANVTNEAWAAGAKYKKRKSKSVKQ